MKKHKSTMIMLLFFFMGLIVLLYPSISNFYNQKVQSKAVANYEELLKEYNEDDYVKILNEAITYNNKLKNLEEPFITHNTISNYKDVLNINGNGMMGYLEIDKIKVELPIYHGTSADVLSKAVGHVEGTSLPIGGIGTHSVLSAHRGLPSFRLFTDLDKLENGDTFTITLLDKKLTYEVDKISIVEPDEVDNLEIDPNNDYVTLLTCTPYGINTHRLLVRGKRIETIEKNELYITTECFRISNLIVMPIVAIPIILTLLLIILFSPIEVSNRELERFIYPTRENKNISEKQTRKKVVKNEKFKK